ncbi:FMN-binding glutamate synthase family protein [Salinicoccus jeotgali]|uniref:FMN-binding glutamate synthase family protein n=1 Tax=Salinicoccus jeotgali TaxID=381634 RepID=A0ABP7E4F5_9STAP
MNTLLIIIVLLLAIVFFTPLVIFGYLYFVDKRQTQHSILRNYPVLGKMRYILEMIGPEMRQYFYNNDSEDRPFNRNEFVFVNKAAKYKDRMIGFGSDRDFEKPGLYLVNKMFPLQHSELKIDQSRKVETKLYQITQEGLISRDEHRHDEKIDPYLLSDEDAIVIGRNTVAEPFRVKGLIGQSAMSFGSLGSHAITALSKGLGMAGGTWMNTGEGSVSPYHEKGDVDLIMQISSGLFGVRTKNGEFSWEEFRNKAGKEKVKAFELKLAQGAKPRGGHVAANKVTEEIAEIRNLHPWQTVDSPNRFENIRNTGELLDFLSEMREVGGKPVGIKLSVGNEAEVEDMVKVMKEKDIIPDFITIDGGNGGSGATYYELAASVGLPTFAALPYMDQLLEKYGLRERTLIIASGQLVTPDKVAMALAMGADLVNIARGFMMSTGCIRTHKCHTNTCPVGVATTDPKLEQALDIEEKKYRVCNYLISLREGLFDLAAIAGIDSPTKFTKEHLIYKDQFKVHGR